MLSLALSLASVGLGMARTDAGLSRAIEICAGGRVAVIQLNAKGEPVAAGHHCAECLLGVALALPPVGFIAFGGQAPALLLAVRGHVTDALASPPQPRAQGPPVTV